ncbi:hypothetical protein B0H99_10526 [Planomicrobium soli]|uniref:Nucleotidyltransferase-like protein n=1 Tax=Planomicrobium soli TaxID=1176648 RepID=A0A2P8H223_9BACL|nr:hypothetical protein [Planomicrobium soli]PSL40250.1 hypothetical protein B0H99_10526 [Planomicrobium soli]
MANEVELYCEFLTISSFLNEELGIVPVLYGSLGLTKVAQVDFSPQDIDILVPLVFLQGKWGGLKQAMKKQGYLLIDLEEHEFQKEDIKIGFAFTEDLKRFAEVDYKKLEVFEEAGAKYCQLSLADYLKVYNQSAQDGYRRTKNDHKDLKKLKILNKLVDSLSQENHF